jgi:hypothetical protein
MLADDIVDRIAIAHPDELDRITRDMWVDHTNGLLTENEMEWLDEAARTRREAIQPRPAGPRPRTPTTPKNAPRSPARRPPRSPDKQASVRRRRRLAASGPLPPELASDFTTCELAALAIMSQEVVKHGTCSLPVAAIAAIAGTCPSVVQDARRKAEVRGYVLVKYRTRQTNVIRVVSDEWLAWLRKRRKKEKKDGSRFTDTTHTLKKEQKPPRGWGVSWHQHYRHYDPGDRSTGRRGP